MTEHLAAQLNIIKIYVCLTFLAVLIYRQKRKKIDGLLLGVLSIAMFNEVLSMLLRSSGNTIAINTNLYVICNGVLWLLILSNLSSYRRTIKILIVGYLIYSTTLLLVFANPFVFNQYIFITGALVYLLMFLITSLKELKRENLQFFLSVDYLLISAPVIFFIGFSMIFGFRIPHLDTVKVMGIQFYDWISYLVNFTLYTVINFYIFRQYKQKHVN